jgi:hypothetical protein
MQTYKSSSELKTAIQLLELEQEKKGLLLKKELIQSSDEIRHGSLVKNAIKGIVNSTNFADIIIGPSIGLVAGYLSKKLIVGKSDNKFRLLMGSVVQFGVKNFVTSNSLVINAYGKQIFQSILSKRKKPKKT